MKIKSLLLGSAAALAAVSGARAADAVVIAEPEPVEYVRVCDAYGAGFFYIPGTETCLRISGYVWYQVGAGNYDGDAVTIGGGAPLAPFASIGTETVGYNDGVAGGGWMKQTRARVNIDARQET
ncbi:porin, partial [Nitratireductor alexandrii]|uniref:porin n=1 Tax=Nitratireductor alexandrii TaxID=2448161 RepID=UPI001EE8BFA3